VALNVNETGYELLVAIYKPTDANTVPVIEVMPDGVFANAATYAFQYLDPIVRKEGELKCITLPVSPTVPVD